MFGLAIWGFTQNANNKEKKEGVKNNITKDGFKPDSLLIKIPLGSNKLIGIAIDRTSNKICLIDEDTKRYIDSIDIIESEVLIDGKTVTKTSRASQFAGAAVGAVLLGGVGAIIGGLSGKTTTEQQAKGVKLKVVVNDINNPFHIIDFIESGNTGSTLPKTAVKEATEWHELLSTLIKINERNAKIRDEPTTIENSSMAEEIKKLKELKETGALSEDEFQQAKEKLISSWS
tara:strand:- start:2147 stop:2839 length:693 start_codon:yes stop_codon:yes gene_type:complete